MQQQARETKYDSEFCGPLPIHLTNLIQPSGVLLVIGKDNLNIIRARGITRGVFSKTVTEVVTSPLASFIEKEAIGSGTSLPCRAACNQIKM
jgi:light-regulated signal transduction histidine kinase (bacteriophytochrome)